MRYKKELLYQGLKSKRNKPINLSENNLVYFEKELIKEINNTYVYELKNAYVTQDGVVFKNFQIFKPSLHHKKHNSWLNIIYILLTILFKKRASYKGTYYLAFNYWGKEYYHWLTESVTRIYCSKKIADPHVVLLPEVWNNIYSFRTMIKSFVKRKGKSKNSEYQTKSLDLLNIKSFKEIPKNSYLKIDRLLLCSYTAPSGNYNDVLLKEISNYFKSKIKQFNFPNTYDKIYISRKKAFRRKVLNENEVEKTLAKYKFTSLCFEDFSFYEQLYIASNCKTLISLHGAGLTNSIFMQPNTSILELRMEGDTTNLCYFSLASSLNINYYYLFCKKDKSELSVQDANISVDCKKLEAIVSKYFPM